MKLRLVGLWIWIGEGETVDLICVVNPVETFYRFEFFAECRQKIILLIALNCTNENGGKACFP